MFTIYGLYEAGKPDEIQYVGCTERTLAVRLEAHVNVANSAPRLPVHKWIFQINGRVECRALQQSKHEFYALQLEKRWIAHYARQGGLLNVLDNPKVRQRRRKQIQEPCQPRPEDPTFGNEAVKNFLHYLRSI